MTLQEIEALCHAVFGRSADRIETPGGSKRKTVTVLVGADRFVLSKRDSPNRAKLEAAVLQALASTGAVPRLLHCDGRFVVQQHVAGTPLAQSLAAADRPGQIRLLQKAINGLLALQTAAVTTDLAQSCPPIGARPGWTADLLHVPQRLAEQFGLVAPPLDHATLIARLNSQPRQFIKWDARPGNAVLRPDQSLCWFDWEHCGLRARADDMVWLLADEWAPDAPEAERHAIDSLAAADPSSAAEVSRYFTMMAILHSFVRLSLIFARKGNGPWWNPETCLRFDLIGVTPDHVARLCNRILRWLDQTPELQGFAPVIDRLKSKALP